MGQVQAGQQDARKRAVVGQTSEQATIKTIVERTDDGVVIVIANATFLHGGELVEANATRTFYNGLIKGDEVLEKKLVDASKREALRELVTQLQLHGVL